MKNNKSIYIVGVFMLITMISIGYAIVSGWLNINGTAKINAAKWEIYFKNVKIKDGSVTAAVKPAISNKTTVNFEVELKKPGDFYEFNVDVVNDGMIDAMIESISITPELTTDQQKYLSYSVTYADGVVIEEKDILHANKSRTLKVKVEYKKNISNSELLSNEETLNVHVEIKYVQADNTAKESTSIEGEIKKFVSLVSGDGTQVGDELAIGDEHFYVMSNDGENITMLSKYNLNATQTYNASMTYKQNLDATISPVQFSATKYWENTSDIYIYDNRASISQYVNNYQAYLESLGAEIIESRLIKNEELVQLGKCSKVGYRCGQNGWLWLTSYWAGTAYSNTNEVYRIYKNNTYCEIVYTKNDDSGVRPVIVIPADSI